jgi:hypothetical protein
MMMISVLRSPDKNGREAIAVVLSQDAMVLNEEGEPYPGVALYPPQAREVAYRLLLYAQEIENARLNGIGKLRGCTEQD